MAGKRALEIFGLLLVAVLLVTPQALGQQYRNVENLSLATVNEAVEVEGTVARWVSGLGGNFYVLRTNWGEEILVRTSRALPAIDKRYRVRGVVTDQHNKRFISEEELSLVTAETTRETETSGTAVLIQVPKAEMEQPLPGAPGQPSPGVPVTGAPSRAEPLSPVSHRPLGGVLLGVGPLPWVLAGAGLLAIAVAVGMLARRKRMNSSEISVGLASSPVAMTPVRAGEEPAVSPARPTIPEPQGVTGTTVKIHRPPAGTLKILPGHFEVVAGEGELKEIRFYKLPTQAVPEVTFGRLAGPPYSHVQLNLPTVSGRQAKLTLDQRSWKLTNFAPPTSNPTRVNGRDLGVDETVTLTEGDRVEMGEVVLLFHER